MIDKVLATPFEIAIGSSGTIESIEQMIHHTVTTPTDSQVSVGKLSWISNFVCRPGFLFFLQTLSDILVQPGI